ncbi:acyltransferase family protein [Streptomyces sp. NPDC090445]|uniref:acyltransferase family protein n=1 Tax=Streptomyces sp. NPDC090445 TaxID=3365963 RepID=UPI00380D92F7
MSLDERRSPGPAGPADAAQASPPSQYRHRLPSLTGLRFPAALLVFWFHAALPVPWIELLASESAEHTFHRLASPAGGLGVTFFFVLSGFILTWTARDPGPARAFWRRRLVKIYPSHAVVWGLAMLTFAAAVTSRGQALANLLLLHGWVPDFPTNFSVNPPSWSLGVEAFCYVAFPLLIAACRRIRPARLMLWITGTVAVVVLTPWFTYAFVPGDGPMVPDEDASMLQYWFAYVLPPVRVFDFLLGILLALAVRAGRWSGPGAGWSGLLLAASYPVALRVPFLYGQRAVFLVPVACLIAAVARVDVRRGFTPFRNRFAVWLGEVSFGFYLVHYPVLVVSRYLLGERLFPVPAAVELLLGQLVVSVLLAWALHAAVERPAVRRWARSRSGQRAAPA